MLSIKEKRALLSAAVLMITTVTLSFSTAFHEAFIIPKRFFLRVFTGVFFFILIYLITKYRIKVPKPFFFYAAAAFFVTTCLSALFSRSLILSLDYCIDLFCYILIFLMVSVLFDREMPIKIIPFLMMIGALVGIYSLIQRMGIDFVEWVQKDLVLHRSISTLGNPDFLSAFLVLLIPIAFCYAYKEKSILLGFPCLAFWGFLCFVNIFTYSRAGLAAMTAGTLTAIALLGKETLSAHWKKTLSVILIFVFALTIPLMLEFTGKSEHSIINRIKGALTGTDINVTTRVYLWKAALEIIKENPILGTGPDTFSIAYLPYRDMEPENIRHRIALPESSHNLFLDIASFSGIIALLLYLSLIIPIIIKGILALLQSSNNLIKTKEDKNSKQTEDDPILQDSEKEKVQAASLAGRDLSHNVKTASAGFLGAVIAYLTHNLFSFPTFPDQLLFWMSLAFIFILLIRDYDSPKVEPVVMKPSVKFASLIIAGTLLLAVLFQGVTTAAADLHYNKGKALHDNLHFHEDPSLIRHIFQLSLREFDQAVEMNKLRQLYWLGRGKMLEQYSHLTKDEEELSWVFREAVISYERAILLNKYNPYPYADLGRLLLSWSFKEQGEMAYKEALRLDPRNVPIMNDLASFYAREKRDKEAEMLFKRVLEIYSEGAWAYGNLGMFYFRKRDFSQAKLYLEKALEIDPDTNQYADTLRIIKEIHNKED